MKALVYTGTQSLDFRDAPMPELQASETLVRIEASGICGSDMHAWHGHDARRIPPMILGHELAGRIEGGPRDGDRVAINPLISCGNCRDCRAGLPNLCASRDLLGLGRAGGYAEHIAAPTANLFSIPDKLDAIHASLMEPTAVSLHAIHLAERVLGRPISECRTLVIGGGAIGALAALLLEQKGARQISIAETSSFRRESLKSMCSADVYDPLGNKLPEANQFELVIDAVGSGATRRSASEMVRTGGVISHIGLQDNKEGLDTRRLTLQEITFIGNYTYNQTDLQAALDLLEDGAIGTLDWVETRPLSEGAQAFNDIHEAKTSAPKIVLIP
ncbi:MAG: alcohol dehydrogenase catalytic domain-containing protein [Granulosicoccus sp.]